MHKRGGGSFRRICTVSDRLTNIESVKNNMKQRRRAKSSIQESDKQIKYENKEDSKKGPH